jgi:large subunit ribosomal protein L25
MVETTTMTAAPRPRAGKGAARQTRRQGRVPGVIYGDKTEPLLVSVDPVELTAEMGRPGFFSRIVEVALDGQSLRVLPREVQRDPVTGRPVHVDFMRFGKDTRLRVDVRVVFANQDKAPGLKRGGVLNVVSHTIPLISAPDAIPESVVADLDGLDIGHSVHVSQMKLPPNVKLAVTGVDLTVATIAAPSILVEVEEKPAEAAEGEAAPAEGEAAAAEGEAKAAEGEAKAAEGEAKKPAEKGDKGEKAEKKPEGRPARAEGKGKK